MKTKTALFPHQAEAYEKLRHFKIGALYMEMGTGKTRTALELIKNRMEQGKVNHVIWLCPCSIQGDIADGIEEHSDLCSGDLLTICGIETLSTSIRAMERLGRIAKAKNVYLIVDESSKVKNPYALRSQHITQLAALCPYRIILNGTPVSKNEADLFSQWYLLDWRILGYRSFYSFAANHIQYDPSIPGKIIRTLNVEYLTEKIAPYSYQCKKSDILDLPEKKTRTKYFCLTDEQYEHYQAITDQLIETLDDRKPETIYRLLGAGHAIISGFRIRLAGDHCERYPFFLSPLENPRIQTLLDVIRSLGAEKAVVFCKYLDEVNAIASILPNAVKFTGEIPQRQRQKVIEDFRGAAQYFISTKDCGSYGLNLQHCHNVIYFSNDWDWGTRIQSEDRLHRIGQLHDVNIIDLCARWTIDEKIQDCLNRKESLSDLFKAKLREGSKGSIRNLIKGRGADGGKVIS